MVNDISPIEDKAEPSNTEVVLTMIIIQFNDKIYERSQKTMEFTMKEIEIEDIDVLEETETPVWGVFCGSGCDQTGMWGIACHS